MEQLGRRAVAVVPLALVPALGVVQGGYGPDTWVWSGALAAWAVALAVVLTPDPGALRREWPWAAATGALLLWTLLSTIWSVNSAQSVLDARRMLLYTAVVLALLVLVRRDTQRLLVPATHLAITALLVYALARYLGTRRYDAFEQYHLSQPLGYANAAGILSVLGLLLGLGLVAGTASRAARAAAAATVPVLALALDFTDSTASILALGVGLAVLALLAPATVRLLAAAALLAPAAAIAAGVGAASRFAVNVGEPRIPGFGVALAAAACAALAAATVALVPLPRAEPPSRRVRRLLLVAILVLALGGAAAVARTGASEPRSSYYHVAWHDEVLAHPVLGTGAASFGRYWADSGKALELGGALDAHSLYLETLAELGPVGLLLLLAMLLAPLRGVLSRRRDASVPTAVAAYAAFLVHAGLDWDWELPAVVVAALCCAGAAATAELEPGRPLGRAVRGALLAAGALLGATAIAGARSDTVPSATPETTKAPRRGAFVQSRD